MSAIADFTGRAFAQALATVQASTPIADCLITPEISAVDLRLPRIVCRVEKPDEMVPGCNVFKGQVTLIVCSAPGDDQGDADPHSIRTRALYELLFDVTLTPAQAAANPRAYAKLLAALNATGLITASCYTFADENFGWDEQHIETSLVLDVIVSAGARP